MRRKIAILEKNPRLGYMLQVKFKAEDEITVFESVHALLEAADQDYFPDFILANFYQSNLKTKELQKIVKTRETAQILVYATSRDAFALIRELRVTFDNPFDLSKLFRRNERKITSLRRIKGILGLPK